MLPGRGWSFDALQILPHDRRCGLAMHPYRDAASVAQRQRRHWLCAAIRRADHSWSNKRHAGSRRAALNADPTRDQSADHGVVRKHKRRLAGRVSGGARKPIWHLQRRRAGACAERLELHQRGHKRTRRLVQQHRTRSGQQHVCHCPCGRGNVRGAQTELRDVRGPTYVYKRRHAQLADK